MARPEIRLPGNVPGPFFVDETCIDCDACRRIAPSSFDREAGQSVVVRQPENENERLEAGQALISCPTSSIGTERGHDLSAAVRSFPLQVDAEVHFCGFTSESSFGAFSYLIVRDEGNILVDSPRFNRPLVRSIDEMGGVALMPLTHIDDVADHAKFAAEFGCDRVMHADDVSRRVAEVEWKLEGADPVEIATDLLAIPTPGHTKGHVVYLYRDRYLFTGDHLAWDRKRERLYAFRNACWYSWEQQIESMERLLDYSFEWVLPGHGAWVNLPKDEMRSELSNAVEWMRRRR